MGLAWSSPEALAPGTFPHAPAGPGLYILTDAGSQEIVYIGQSAHCARRLEEHAGKFPDEKELRFSFHGLENTVLPHQLRERENDLIGNYYEQYRKAPEFQFRNRQ